MSEARSRRVVITGMGVVCPLGLSLESLWSGLSEGRSAVGPLDAFPADGLPLRHAAQARDFTAKSTTSARSTPRRRRPSARDSR